MKRFFSYDPQTSFTLHDTAEQAERAAQESMTAYRGDAQADGEWTHEDDVRGVCWGELREAVAETRTPEGVDFALTAITV